MSRSALDASWWTATPPTSISPDVGRSSPASRRRSVDFPLPDAPTTAVMAASENSASTPRRASTVPVPVVYVFTTSARAAARLSAKAQHLREIRPRGRAVGERPADEGDDRDCEAAEQGDEHRQVE